jgi:hypothetical protein
MVFTRQLSDNFFAALKSAEHESLLKKLALNICSGEIDSDEEGTNGELLRSIFLDDFESNQQVKRYVFPAIRNERIDFYYGGGKLFSFDPKKGFSTHHKYASVLVKDPDKKNEDYILEATLQNDKASSGGPRLIRDFSEGYERIKENCALFSGLEAKGVSALYEKFSWAIGKKNEDVVVLDIEASFEGLKDNQTSKDRIDIVAFDIPSKTLRFFEAKHYSNSSALRTADGSPKVIEQLKRYKKQLEEKKEEILSAYQSYVKLSKKLFPNEMPEPTNIDTDPRLLIFGFDRQQQDYLNKNILSKINNISDKPSCYAIGNIAGAKLATIFKGGR